VRSKVILVIQSDSSATSSDWNDTLVSSCIAFRFVFTSRKLSRLSFSAGCICFF